MINHHQGLVSSCHSSGLVLWVEGQSSIYTGQDWAMSLGQPSILQHQHLRSRSTWSITLISKILLELTRNGKIAQMMGQMFLSKDNCWNCIWLLWCISSVCSLSMLTAVQMLTFVCLLAVISTRVEICKELNIIVTFHNLYHRRLVKHPHALLSF